MDEGCSLVDEIEGLLLIDIVEGGLLWREGFHSLNPTLLAEGETLLIEAFTTRSCDKETH